LFGSLCGDLHTETASPFGGFASRRNFMKIMVWSMAVALLFVGNASLVRAEEFGEEFGEDWVKAEVCCTSSGGFVGGVELTGFKLYGSQGAGGTGSVAPPNFADYFPSYGFRGEGRYWIGYELASGCGIRGRLFDWEANREYLGLVREQDIEMYDIEGTVDMSGWGWNVTGFGGLRWGSIELDGSDFGEPNPYNFNGAGLTGGFDFRRCVWRDLSVVGGARFSMLYGDTNFLPITAEELSNTNVDIWEARLGVEWARQTRFGGRFFVSAAWEHQLYGTDTYFPFAIDPETLGDVSLAGPVFSIGLDR
jgi:hypothetical protein